MGHVATDPVFPGGSGPEEIFVADGLKDRPEANGAGPTDFPNDRWQGPTDEPLVDRLYSLPADERIAHVAGYSRAERALILLAALALDGLSDKVLAESLQKLLRRDSPRTIAATLRFLRFRRLAGVSVQKTGTESGRTGLQPGAALVSRSSWGRLCQRSQPGVADTHARLGEGIRLTFACCGALLLLPGRGAQGGGCPECRPWFEPGTTKTGTKVTAAEECLVQTALDVLSDMSGAGHLYGAAFGAPGRDNGTSAVPLRPVRPADVPDIEAARAEVEVHERALRDAREHLKDALSAWKADRQNPELRRQLLDSERQLAALVSSSRDEQVPSRTEFFSRFRHLIGRLEQGPQFPGAVLGLLNAQSIVVSPRIPRAGAASAPFVLEFSARELISRLGYAGRMTSGARERLQELPARVYAVLDPQRFQASIRAAIERQAASGAEESRIAAELGVSPEVVAQVLRPPEPHPAAAESAAAAEPTRKNARTKKNRAGSPDAELHQSSSSVRPVPLSGPGAPFGETPESLVTGLRGMVARYEKGASLPTLLRGPTDELPPVLPKAGSAGKGARRLPPARGIQAMTLLERAGRHLFPHIMMRPASWEPPELSRDWRFQEAADQVYRGAWPRPLGRDDASVVRRIAAVLRATETGEADLRSSDVIALRMRVQPGVKAVVEARLLAKEPVGEIATSLDLPAAALTAYVDFFGRPCESNLDGPGRPAPFWADNPDRPAIYLARVAQEERLEGLHAAIGHLMMIEPAAIPHQTLVARLTPGMFLERHFRWVQSLLGADEPNRNQLSNLYQRFREARRIRLARRQRISRAAEKLNPPSP